ncbi:MAG: ribonuclease D [Anaerolineaceae bacterium]|nr:ribonuclease D [Anaerolineaceae bacterium]
MKDPIWVAGQASLDRLVNSLAQQGLIAVDTESNSLYAYQEQVCLIQFSAGSNDYLVDPLAKLGLEKLGPIFADPQIEKVFHAAEYDLICLKRDFGFAFNNLFDTMQAARILGKSGLGLGTMLEQQFGIQADKRLQRANWARRPLSAEMMAYARMDTHYLVALREMLKQELVDANRWELAEEDFSRLTLVPAGNHENGGGSWWRLSGVQDLSPRQAAVLMELFSYRDERAKAMNQPPFRVIPNQTLVELARLMPRKRSEFHQIYGLSPKLVDRFGDGILEAVGRGIIGPPAYRPQVQRPSDMVLGRMETLRNWRKLTAREMGVESDIVLPRDVLEVIADRNPQGMEDLHNIMEVLPWRLDRFGRDILKALN